MRKGKEQMKQLRRERKKEKPTAVRWAAEAIRVAATEVVPAVVKAIPTTVSHDLAGHDTEPMLMLKQREGKGKEEAAEEEREKKGAAKQDKEAKPATEEDSGQATLGGYSSGSAKRLQDSNRGQGQSWKQASESLQTDTALCPARRFAMIHSVASRSLFLSDANAEDK